MLTFNKLGKSGRLGNQMFQYAALRGIAANCGWEWAVPPPGTSGVDEFGTENNYCMFEIIHYLWMINNYYQEHKNYF